MNTLGLKQYDILSSAVNQKANYIILKVRKKADKSHIFSLKLLRNNIEDENDRNYLRLRNEYEILQNLNSEPQTFLVHPNALKLENGLAFYEMQQLDGRPLGAMLQSAARPFPLAFVVEFAKQAAQALAYCHFDVISNYTPLTTGGKPKKLLFKEEQKLVEKHTIIINNLSPDSFIYTKDNRFILANFEYAIAYGADSSNVALETDADAYRAPEKWEQNGFVSILKEGDIYAFGAILYTMLLGVEPPAPFSENYGESFSADALKKSRMLLESNDTSDADFLYAIVAKCLQKEPENRFYDGKELYNAILNENSGGEEAAEDMPHPLLQQTLPVQPQPEPTVVQPAPNNNVVAPVPEPFEQHPVHDFDDQSEYGVVRREKIMPEVIPSSRPHTVINPRQAVDEEPLETDTEIPEEAFPEPPLPQQPARIPEQTAPPQPPAQHVQQTETRQKPLVAKPVHPSASRRIQPYDPYRDYPQPTQPYKPQSTAPYPDDDFDNDESLNRPILPELEPKTKKRRISPYSIAFIIVLALIAALLGYLYLQNREANSQNSELRFRTTENGKFGFKDGNDKLVIPCIYDTVSDFVNQMARVEKDHKIGYIDMQGKEIIPVKYDVLDDFEKNSARFKLNGKYGIMDGSGQYLAEPVYDNIDPFHYELAWVKKDDKRGFINTRGEVVVPVKYDACFNFEEDGLARVKMNNKWGYVDRDGNETIPCEYDIIEPFGAENMAYVQKGERCGYIDRQGRSIIPIVYDFLDKKFSDGLLRAKQNALYGYLDVGGKIIIPFKYTKAEPFNNGFAIVERREPGFLGIGASTLKFKIDKTGKELQLD